jgi:uncharacterized protein YuzE
MNIEYDRQVDAVDVSLSDQVSVFTRVVDDLRLIDYDAEGKLVGLEFLRASGGVRLGGLPLHSSGVDATDLARLLKEADVPVIDDVEAPESSIPFTSMNVAAPRVPRPSVTVVSTHHRSRVTDFSEGLVRP